MKKQKKVFKSVKISNGVKNTNFLSKSKGLLIFVLILGLVIGLGVKIIITRAATLTFTAGTDIQFGGNTIHDIGPPGGASTDAATVDYVDGAVTGTAKYIPKYDPTTGIGFSDSAIYDNAGKIGIGTTGPVAPLHVSHGLSQGEPGIILENADSGQDSDSAIRFSASSNNFTLGINNYLPTGAFIIADGTDLSSNQRLVIDSSGNVGIGTTGPSAPLHISGRVYQSDLGSSTFFGYEAGLNDDLSDNKNVAMGYQALHSNTTGADNTANGYQSLYSNITGTYNTANGYQSLYSNTANGNTANGNRSLYNNTTGYSNTANGFRSLYSNITGAYNTADGYYSLFSNTANGNTANGYEALYSNTTGTYNTANGYHSLYNNVTGSGNIALGGAAGYNDTGTENIVIGYAISSVNTSGNYQLRIGNSQHDFIVGDSSGNVGIGVTSPSDKLDVLDTAAGGGGITTSHLTLGKFSDGSADPAKIQHYAVEADAYIGLAAGAEGDDHILLMNGNVGIGTDRPKYQLELSKNSAAKPTSSSWTISSDERIKTNIIDFTSGLDVLNKMRPITYNYNGRGGKGYDDNESHIGFIAQEIQEIAPYMIDTYIGELDGKETELLNYDAHALPFILINAIKEQQEQIKELEQRLRALEK